MRRWMLLWAMVAMLLTAACTGGRATSAALPPLDPAALADPNTAGARYALDRYLAARSARDYAKVYEVLSIRTQKAYTLEELQQFFKEYERYSAGHVGAPQDVKDGWARFPIHDVTWVMRGHPPAAGELWFTTVHHDGQRWGVALADPLVGRANAASVSGSADALHQVADLMLSVDPFSFRAYVQKGYAFLIAGDARASLNALGNAAVVVPPPVAHEVFLALGDVLQAANQPRQAADHYRKALDVMTDHEGLHDSSTLAAVNRTLARVSLQAGDKAAAGRAAVTAQILSPFDGRNHALAGAVVLQ